jgi:hypothetical protein
MAGETMVTLGRRNAESGARLWEIDGRKFRCDSVLAGSILLLAFSLAAVAGV